MIPLKLNETANLAFTVALEGTNETPECRLVLSLREGQEFSLAGVYENGQVKVSVPSLLPLENMLEEEDVDARLEVLVDGHYFTPWRDQFRLEAPVGVESDLLNERELQESSEKKVQAQVGTVTVSTSENESFEARLRKRLGNM